MINTGIYIPGSSFEPRHVSTIIGNQMKAVAKGSYAGSPGKKQRVLVVDDENAKTELQRLLTIGALEEMYGTRATPQLLHDTATNFGGPLSQRIMTVSEYQQQKIEGGVFDKLYIEAVGRGRNSKSFSIYEHKESPWKTGAVSGVVAGLGIAAICALSGGNASTVAKAGTIGGTLGFIWGYESQSSKPEYEPHSVTCDQMAKRLDEKELQCRNIRVLSYSSGDRSMLYDITSEEDKARARTEPPGGLALDEALAAGIRKRHPHERQDYHSVSGYQGLCGSLGKVPLQHHIVRRSEDARQQPIVEREARQSTVRVETQIWP